MCTITLEYNQNNALARRKLAALLATGLFIQKGIKPNERLRVGDQRSGMPAPYEPTQEELQAHRELRDAVLEHSRKSMSHIIARYL